jgi:SAM-dependent methyltransferase
VAHLLATRPVEVVDIRPLPVSVDGLTFLQADATHLAPLADLSVASLSSLHAVEHFGLGRYGDEVDLDAPARALDEFRRVLAPGGRLFLSVPIGRRRVDFNAHRVFDPLDVVEMLPGLQLVRFDAIDDDGVFHEVANPASFAGENYGLGIYVFEKPLPAEA